MNQQAARRFADLLDAQVGSPAKAGGDLTVAEVAAELRRSISTVRGWIEDGRFPGAYHLPSSGKCDKRGVSGSERGAFPARRLRRAGTVQRLRATSAHGADQGARRHDVCPNGNRSGLSGRYMVVNGRDKQAAR